MIHADFSLHMRLEHHPVEKLKYDLKTICDRYVRTGTYRLFFFGSRVTGKGNEHSDIDVGIEAKKPISFRTMAKIKEDLDDLPILYKIELVDFKMVPEEFRKVALQAIELIVSSHEQI